jgi:hypothetical protein
MLDDRRIVDDAPTPIDDFGHFRECLHSVPMPCSVSDLEGRRPDVGREKFEDGVDVHPRVPDVQLGHLGVPAHHHPIDPDSL